MPQQPRDLTVAQAKDLAEWIAPHLTAAVKTELAPTFQELRDGIAAVRGDVASVRADVVNLKAHSGIWGAAGGVLTSLVAALPSMLKGSKANPIAWVLALVRGH